MQARYHVEYMDAKHHSAPAYLEKLLALYREKYTGSHFDGIILTDDHALDLVAQYREELFRGHPLCPAASMIPNRSRPMSAT
jgi:hypothetical protein